MQDGDVEHVFYKVIVGDVIVTAAQFVYVEPEKSDTAAIVVLAIEIEEM